jgi:hypothetical protein
VENENAYQAKNEVQRQFDQRHAKMDKNLQKLKLLMKSYKNF